MSHRCKFVSILSVAVALAGLLGGASGVHAAAFTAGDIVVSRVGDGNLGLGGFAAAIFLDEYTTGGSLVQSIALPTTTSGSNFALTVAGTSTSEGQLQLSPDNTTLSLIGFNAGVGATVTSTVASTVNRVVGLIKNDGTPNTTTNINTTTTGDVRSAISDGTNIWYSTDSHGIEYVTAGSVGAPVQINSANPVNTHVVGISGGQLYISSATSSGADFGISTVGVGESTTAGQSVTELSGFPTTTGPTPYDFYFADANDLFVADDRTSGGGLQHWALIAGTWKLAYAIAPSGVGFRSVAGANALGNLTMYAVGTDNKVYAITDSVSDTTGTGASFASIATGGTNEVFRGVDFVPVATPEPASLGLLVVGGLLLVRRRR